METKGRILDNYSIAQFKAKHNASNEKLEVIKNPKTGKFFMAIAGERVGTVADEIKYDRPLQVIKVEDKDDPTQEVFILCNRNVDNIVVSI